MQRSTKIVLTVALGVAAIGAAAQGTRAWAGEKDHKVAICHGTASQKNPYVLIVVDESALRGHFDGTTPGHGKNNAPDFLAVNGSCDTPNSSAFPNS